MEDETRQKALRALSDPTRFRIVDFLSHMCCGTAAVDEEGGVYDGPTASEVCCHLTGAEKINSTISHHLHELEDAGLIRIKRRGKRMICSLRREAFEALADRLRLIAKGETQNECSADTTRKALKSLQVLQSAAAAPECCSDSGCC